MQKYKLIIQKYKCHVCGSLLKKTIKYSRSYSLSCFDCFVSNTCYLYFENNIFTEFTFIDKNRKYKIWTTASKDIILSEVININDSIVKENMVGYTFANPIKVKQSRLPLIDVSFVNDMPDVDHLYKRLKILSAYL